MISLTPRLRVLVASVTREVSNCYSGFARRHRRHDGTVSKEQQEPRTWYLTVCALLQLAVVAGRLDEIEDLLGELRVGQRPGYEMVSTKPFRI